MAHRLEGLQSLQSLHSFFRSHNKRTKVIYICMSSISSFLESFNTIHSKTTDNRRFTFSILFAFQSNSQAVDHFLDNFSRTLPGITITKSLDLLSRLQQIFEGEDSTKTLRKPTKTKIKMYTTTNLPKILLLLSLSHLTLGNPTPIPTQTTLLIPTSELHSLYNSSHHSV